MLEVEKVGLMIKADGLSLKPETSLVADYDRANARAEFEVAASSKYLVTQLV